MNHRAIIAFATLALVGVAASLAFAQPFDPPGRPNNPGPPEFVGNLSPAGLGQRIRRGDQAVFIFIVRKNNSVDLLSDCRPQPCDVRNTGGMVGGPVNTYSFQKFIAREGEDPCITWTDTSGTLQRRCWD